MRPSNSFERAPWRGLSHLVENGTKELELSLEVRRGSRDCRGPARLANNLESVQGANSFATKNSSFVILPSIIRTWCTYGSVSSGSSRRAHRHTGRGTRATPTTRSRRAHTRATGRGSQRPRWRTRGRQHSAALFSISSSLLPPPRSVARSCPPSAGSRAACRLPLWKEKEGRSQRGEGHAHGDLKTL